MYSRNVQGRELTFTFNPNKYLDNLMLSDTETGSLWSQLELRAVDGQLRAARLQILPTVQTTWKHWRSIFPDTQVFDPISGGGAVLSHRSLQSIANLDDVEQDHTHAAGPIRPLELVLGLAYEASSKAYPFSQLAARVSPLRDSLEDRPVLIHFDRQAYAAWATDKAGELLPAVTTRWRTWQSFHPDTTAWSADPESTGLAEDGAGESKPAEQAGADSRNKTPAE